jgi:hypothetical protein
LKSSSSESADASGAMVRMNEGPMSRYKALRRRRGTLIGTCSSMSMSRPSKLYSLRIVRRGV